jgi:hypothetical protein
MRVSESHRGSVLIDAPRVLRVMISVAVALASARAASAQSEWSVAHADSLLASGEVAAAESLYYASSNSRPRDAVARAALGRYLAARGALRIGAVLLEEARLFGGDTASIARALAPIYSSLGDYRALATLPRSPLSKAERERVRWLVGHAPVLEFPDSVDTLQYRPVTDGSGLGVVAIGIGEQQIEAVIDPRVPGLVLRGKARRRRGLKSFGNDSMGVIAVVPELRVGEVAFSNVLGRIETDESLTEGPAPLSSVGLDIVQRLAPTFDPVAKSIILRRTGQIASATAGTRLPILVDASGMRVLIAGHWELMTSKPASELLSTRRWILDARRGAIIVQ